jgi:hypothetical protein
MRLAFRNRSISGSGSIAKSKRGNYGVEAANGSTLMRWHRYQHLRSPDASLRCKPVLIVRPVSIIKNRIHCLQIRSFWVQPRVDVFSLDWHNAPVVAGSLDFWRRLISDGSER